MDRPVEHKVLVAPCGTNENAKVYKLVRFVMVMDIARDKFEYAKRNLEFWKSVNYTYI
jgi:hypothetical protein